MTAATVVFTSALVAAAQQLPAPRFADRVNVARMVVDARVLDDLGQPVLGLTAEDFSVRVDGRPARVESATWIGTNAGAAGVEPLEAAADVTRQLPEGPQGLQDPQGRLIVFLFQKDLEPTRIVGLMRMLLKAQDFLDGLTPDDRVAIVSFDSHLKIWLDFTNDRARLGRVLERGLLLERPAPIGEETSPVSLTRRLTQAEARRTYPIEKGLRLIGEALDALPGAKSIVLVGHGFGRYGAGGVTMEPEYEEAVAALRDARISVFSLDTTQADYHSLEVGLQLIAAGTGGFYERTHVFPDRAMRRLAGALAGHYVLIVEPPGESAESSDVANRRSPHLVSTTVKLTRRKGTVLASGTDVQ
jgi:VWFA-related protein